MHTFPVYEANLNILRMLIFVRYMDTPSGYLDFESKGVFLQDDTRFDCKLVKALEELVMWRLHRQWNPLIVTESVFK